MDSQTLLDLYRELYIGASGIMIGVMAVIIYYRLQESERWAKGLAFVAASLIGFLMLTLLGFASHIHDSVTTVRIFFYPVPLVLLAIGAFLIFTSDIHPRGHMEDGNDEPHTDDSP